VVAWLALAVACCARGLSDFPFSSKIVMSDFDLDDEEDSVLPLEPEGRDEDDDSSPSSAVAVNKKVVLVKCLREAKRQ
jgi:hypothetical protein